MKKLQWPLIVGLGAFALIRPVLNIISEEVEGVNIAAPILATVMISVVWICVVGFFRVNQPVLTLVFAGITYAVLSILLSGILSTILNGELQGPLAQPAGIIPILLVNVVWGGLAGLLAWLLQVLLGRRAR